MEAALRFSNTGCFLPRRSPAAAVLQQRCSNAHGRGGRCDNCESWTAGEKPERSSLEATVRCRCHRRHRVIFGELLVVNTNARFASSGIRPRDLWSCRAKNGSFAAGFNDEEGEELGDASNQDGKHCSSLVDALEEEARRIDSAVEGRSVLPVSSPVKPPTYSMNGFTSRVGVLITAGYFLLAAGALILMDSHNLRTIPQSVVPFFLTSPFLLSAAVTAVVGYCFVPVLKYFKATQIFRIEGPSAHAVKIGTPTMGGIFFVPVGLGIACLFTGFSSIEVQGVTAVTLAFAAIGLMDDGLAFWRKHNYGLPGWIKFALQVAVGMNLFFWLDYVKLSSPQRMKHEVWLPVPFGIVQLGNFYLPLTAFCCAAMSNGVNLTDGLDGLAGGTAAAALIGMSIVVLPSFPALGVFGSSMAGACFGFLVHNRYKAKVFMGDTGSLALGGALAAMASCSGMFFPLFVASGVFVLETASVMGQVFYFKMTKRISGEGRRWLLMAPFHHHLEVSGLKEPVIITLAYTVSMVLAILAAYLVLAHA